jgi:iron complex outermembrane receptor protein
VGKFGQYAVFNAEVAFRPLDKLELALTGKNLFDRRYEYVWYDTSVLGRCFAQPAQPGRRAGVTASARVRRF